MLFVAREGHVMLKDKKIRRLIIIVSAIVVLCAGHFLLKPVIRKDLARKACNKGEYAKALEYVTGIDGNLELTYKYKIAEEMESENIIPAIRYYKNDIGTESALKRAEYLEKYTIYGGHFFCPGEDKYKEIVIYMEKGIPAYRIDDHGGYIGDEINSWISSYHTTYYLDPNTIELTAKYVFNGKGFTSTENYRYLSKNSSSYKDGSYKSKGNRYWFSKTQTHKPSPKKKQEEVKTSSKKSSSYKKYTYHDSYDDGYDDVYFDDDYDEARYQWDSDYADGVDDAMEDVDW